MIPDLHATAIDAGLVVCDDGSTFAARCPCEGHPGRSHEARPLLDTDITRRLKEHQRDGKS